MRGLTSGGLFSIRWCVSLFAVLIHTELWSMVIWHLLDDCFESEDLRTEVLARAL